MKPTIFQHGPLIGQVAPVAMTSFTRRTGLSLARKPVFGGRQPIEHTGEADDQITLALRLFPERWGGEKMIEAYDEARRSALPMPLMRGGRRNMGFYVCESMERTESEIGVFGAGKIIEVSLDLIRSEPNRSPEAVAQVFGLF